MIWHRQKIADYVRLCLQLFWQRQAMLAAGLFMVGYFYNVQLALLSYGMCQLAELHDLRVCHGARAWGAAGGYHPAHLVSRLMRSAALSAGSIAFAMVTAAIQEGPGLHLGPLVFLFIAALYAAMNTCQIRRLMRVRLEIYRAAILFVALRDLVLVRPPLDSVLWLQLITVVAMLFMLRECARSFSAGYRSVRTRLSDLREERDAVAEAYEVQTRFVSVVSHELRTPLTSIKASLDLIGDQGQAMTMEDAQRIASIGQKNTHRLARLIDDLLDFQKLSAGKMMFRMEPVDLATLVQETVDTNRALGAARGIVFDVSGPAHPLWVEGDAGRLQQVVLNLLSNAAKFSREGGEVRLRVLREAGVARVLVQDDGVGIPEAARGRVFAPFGQVDASDRRAAGGTGLGMSISLAIMEAHGGNIDFDSTVDVGTTFVVEMAALSSHGELQPADMNGEKNRSVRSGLLAATT